jgi:hypothetical protein
MWDVYAIDGDERHQINSEPYDCDQVAMLFEQLSDERSQVLVCPAGDGRNESSRAA